MVAAWDFFRVLQGRVVNDISWHWSSPVVDDRKVTKKGEKERTETDLSFLYHTSPTGHRFAGCATYLSTLPSYHRVASNGQVAIGNLNTHTPTMANSINSDRSTTIRRALETARTSPDGHIDPEVNAILERAIQEVFQKINAHPDSYILSRDEFALFNYSRNRFPNADVGQRAVERFWNNFRGNASEIDGYRP